MINCFAVVLFLIFLLFHLNNQFVQNSLFAQAHTHTHMRAQALATKSQPHAYTNNHLFYYVHVKTKHNRKLLIIINNK